jgi:hypothetical protein
VVRGKENSCCALLLLMGRLGRSLGSRPSTFCILNHSPLPFWACLAPSFREWQVMTAGTLRQMLRP